MTTREARLQRELANALVREERLRYLINEALREVAVKPPLFQNSSDLLLKSSDLRVPFGSREQPSDPMTRFQNAMEARARSRCMGGRCRGECYRPQVKPDPFED